MSEPAPAVLAKTRSVLANVTMHMATVTAVWIADRSKADDGENSLHVMSVLALYCVKFELSRQVTLHLYVMTTCHQCDPCRKQPERKATAMRLHDEPRTPRKPSTVRGGSSPIARVPRIPDRHKTSWSRRRASGQSQPSSRSKDSDCT